MNKVDFNIVLFNQNFDRALLNMNKEKSLLLFDLRFFFFLQEKQKARGSRIDVVVVEGCYN